MTKQRLKTLQLKQGQDMRKQCLQASKQDLHETRIINYHVWTKRYLTDFRWYNKENKAIGKLWQTEVITNETDSL